MTPENLRTAQIAARLGAWEVVLQLYHEAFARDPHQVHTGLFDNEPAWVAWRSEHGHEHARIKRKAEATVAAERRITEGRP